MFKSACLGLLFCSCMGRRSQSPWSKI